MSEDQEIIREIFSDFPNHALDPEPKTNPLSPYNEFTKNHFHNCWILLGIGWTEYQNTPVEILDFLLDKANESLTNRKKSDEPAKESKGSTILSHFHLCIMLALSDLFGGGGEEN